VALIVAPLQLVLFVKGWSRRPAVIPTDLQRKMRTADQWIRSILAYLDWRAGDCWRNLSFREQRSSPSRWEYLNAARLVSDLRYSFPVPAASLPPPKKPPKPHPVSKFDSLSRAQLVDRLLQADSRLSSRKLLSGLARPKLAAMLTRALEVTA
jgi:hypothetical protein